LDEDDPSDRDGDQDRDRCGHPTGMISARSGTAIRASPNPKADRITVARNSTASTGIVA
jgi:hypothetical protein